MKKIFFLFLIIIFISNCTSITKNISYKSDVYNVDNIEFFYDINYEKDGERIFEQQIWQEAYKILDESQDFFLMDIFVFNDYMAKGIEEKINPIYISKEFSEKILEKKEKNPDIDIFLLLDESNTFYGAYTNPNHKILEDAGVKIGYVDLAKLRDPMITYSTIWRLFIQPFGNPTDVGKIKNPFYENTPDITIRSILRAANAKANHRKLIMNEKTVLITSANPHAEGSKNTNVAFKFSSPILKEIYEFEKPVAAITKNNNSLQQYLPDKDFSHIPYSSNEDLKIQYFTEEATSHDISAELSNTTSEDKVFIAQFFLSDRILIRDIKKAAKKGVSFKILVNNSPSGVPNKASTAELMKYAKKHNLDIEVKYYNSGNEVFHAKMLTIFKPNQMITYAGSTNFTRRNMRGYNLENEIKIISSYDQSISNDLINFYNRIWNNIDGIYSLDYEDHKNDSIFNNWLYRFLEINGFGIF